MSSKRPWVFISKKVNIIVIVLVSHNNLLVFKFVSIINFNDFKASRDAFNINSPGFEEQERINS